MKKRDIFNGNVASPGEFIFIYVLIGAVIVGFLVFSVCSILFHMCTEDNTDRREVTFVSCAEKDGDLVLTGDDNMRYELYGEPSARTAEEAERICAEKKPVTVYTETATSKSNEDYYVIRAMRDADTYVVTFDETNARYVQLVKPVIIVFSVMLLLWGAIVVCSIIVGRHPERYSRGVKRLFFKDGSIRY